MADVARRAARALPVLMAAPAMAQAWTAFDVTPDAPEGRPLV